MFLWGAFTQKVKVQFALNMPQFVRFQRRKPCKSGFKQILLTYNYAKQVNATRKWVKHEKRKDNLKRQLHKAVFVVALPYQVCKVCKQQMQLFFKLVVQVTVFFQRRFKRAVQANFCVLQRCTFPTRGLASFWTCLLSATVLRQTLFQTCGASYRVFVTAFQNGSAGKFCVLHFALFRQECSQVFGRACFQQSYYDKRCCEICYLLPKIWNFTKKIAKKYLKPLTVFGDWYIM